MLKKQNIILILSFGFSSAVLASSAYAINATGTKVDYGASVTTNFADREIKLTPATKWANVTDGETVRFTADGKSFAWHFDTFNQSTFDLSTIAPKDVHVEHVRVYVESNPLYRGG